jgi:hypothetical protein
MQKQRTELMQKQRTKLMQKQRTEPGVENTLQEVEETLQIKDSLQSQMKRRQQK